MGILDWLLARKSIDDIAQDRQRKESQARVESFTRAKLGEAIDENRVAIEKNLRVKTILEDLLEDVRARAVKGQQR